MATSSFYTRLEETKKAKDLTEQSMKLTVITNQTSYPSLPFFPPKVLFCFNFMSFYSSLVLFCSYTSMFRQLSFTIPNYEAESQLESSSSVPQTGVHAYMHVHIQRLGKNEFKYLQSVTTTGIPVLLWNRASADSMDSTKTNESNGRQLHFPKLFEHSLLGD